MILLGTEIILPLIFTRKSLTAISTVVYNFTIMKYLVTDSIHFDNDNHRHRPAVAGHMINCMINGSKSNYDYLLPFYVLLVTLCLSAVLYYAILMMYRHRLLQKIGSRLFMYQIDSLEDLGSTRQAAGVVTDDETDGLSTKVILDLTSLNYS